MTEPVRFSENLTLRAAPDVTAAVDRAARAQGTRPSEYVRRAVRKALERDGVELGVSPARDAGTLYDSLNGKQSWALVSSGRVLIVVQYADKPDLADVNYHPAGYVPADGDAWLPIAWTDSEPYDPSLHYRAAYVERVEAERVVREYQIIEREAL